MLSRVNSLRERLIFFFNKAAHSLETVSSVFFFENRKIAKHLGTKCPESLGRMAALCSGKLASSFVCGKGSACHPQWVVTSVPEEASDLPAEDRPTDTWRLPAATSARSARMAIEDVGPEVARCNSCLVALPRPVCPALSSVAVWTPAALLASRLPEGRPGSITTVGQGVGPGFPLALLPRARFVAQVLGASSGRSQQEHGI